MRNINVSDWKFFPNIDDTDITEKKIKSFRTIERGWHYGEGYGPRDEVINDAVTLNREAKSLGFGESDAFPGIDGEITFVVYHKEYDLEFTIHPSRLITYYLMRDEEDLQVRENIKLEEAEEIINDYWEEKCRSSDYSNLITMTSIEGDLGVTDSQTLEPRLASPLLVGSA